MEASDLFPPEEFLTTGEFTRLILGDREPGPAAVRDVSAAVVRHFLQYPWFFIRNFCYTIAKDTSEVLVDPFVGQTLLYFVRECQRRQGFAQRVIEIKPRQVGWTTMNLAMGFHKMFKPRSRVAVLVMDDDVAADFMIKVNTFYNALPSALVPMKRIDNPKLLVFDNPDPRSRERRRGFSSSFNITTPSAMRGKTPNDLTISEAAHMPQFQAILDGMVQAMPIDASSCVMIDTTPAGFDDIYYPMVVEAVKRNPQWVRQWERKGAPTREEIFAGALGMPDDPGGGWVPVFMPWFWHEQYGTKEDSPRAQLPPLDDKMRQHIKATLGKLDQYGGEEESELHERYGVSFGRLAWRRYMLNNATGNPDITYRLLSFRQEYAATWHGCFVEYNRSPFDRVGLDALSRQRRDPLCKGLLRTDGAGAIYVDQTAGNEFQEARFYALPEPTERYTIGVDTATAYESKDSDNSVALVLRRRDDKVVALYVAKAPPHVLRDQIALLYRWYNNAYLAIETEGVGYALPRQLFDMGIRAQYYYKRLDRDVPVSTEYLGWETNSKTRPDMEATLIELIAKRDSEGRPDPGLIVPDFQVLQELQTAKRYPDGAIRAEGKSKDDCVMALMIALLASRDPYYPYPRPRESAPPTPPLSRLAARYRSIFASAGTRNRPKYEEL